MSFEAVLDFAMRYHYPSLSLCNGRVVSAGIDGWFSFLAQHSEGDMHALIERVQQWQAIEQGSAEVLV